MRLGDLDALRQDWLENGQNEYIYDTNAVLYSIDAQPTIDAVPVVRCKDCKYEEKCRQYVEQFVLVNYVTDTGIAKRHLDFCSYGKRKEDNPNVNHNS